MARQKLTERNTATTSTSDDYIHIVKNGISYKIKKQHLLSGIVSGFIGSVAAADAVVTEDGIYICSDSGTYTNNGGLVVDLTTNLTFISVEDTQTTFVKIEIPVSSFGYNIVTSLANFDSLITGATSGTWLILDSFALDGNKTLPTGVTLEFRGGIISGAYTITGDDTKINAELKQIFNSNVLFDGTWDLDKVYPEWFGAVGDGVTDNSTEFQTALDLLKPVIVSTGDWVIDNLELKTGMHLEGISKWECQLVALPASVNPLFYLTVGDVRGIKISNFRITGNDTLNQNCFNFIASGLVASPYHGGLWNSNFSHLEIRNFRGTSLNFKGHESNNLEVNQFCTFTDIFVKRPDFTEAKGVVMTGQNGQIDFRACILDGNDLNHVGYNVIISRVFSLGDVTDGGSALGDISPYNISFSDNTTSQSSEHAIYIDRGRNININGCYFENTKYCITATGSSEKVNVTQSAFYNAGSDGVGGGYCLETSGGSFAVFRDNYIVANTDRVVENNGFVDMGNNYSSDTANISTNVVKAVGLSVNTLTLESGAAWALQTNTSDLETIVSKMATGSVAKFYITGFGNYLKLTNAGNLVLPNSQSLILRHRDSFDLMRENTDTYVVKNVTQAKLQASSIPTSGYYERGEFVWNTLPSIDGNNMVLLGWSRIVTGTAHVSGTDWGLSYVSTVSPAT